MESTKKIYESIYIDGYYHKVSSMKYDSSKKIKYVIGSFISGQMFDNCLTLMQKGQSLQVNHEKFYTLKKGYLSKSIRVRDENQGDGVHGLIIANDENTIRVYKGENKIDKVFEYLKSKTQCGLMDEWKTYFYNELYSSGHIEECEGFDYTNKAPDILVMKDIDTKLVRNIKAIGLKNNRITLPVDEVEEIDPAMSFLEIIEKLIIPNIEQEECHYNVGDPISDIFKAPIINVEKGTKKVLYPRQQIIGQGCLNAINDSISAPIICLGMGTGKTLISARLSYAIIKDHFKTDNARIGLMIPSHLLKKWIRELKEAYNPLGINPTFHIIKRFKDVDKLPKKPKGIEIVIFQKDITKRTYLYEYSGIKKHKANDIDNYVYGVKDSDSEFIIANCNLLKLSEMKLAAIKIELNYKKKVVLYKPQYNSEGEISEYKVVTTSSTIKDTFGRSGKAFDFKINDIQKINDVAESLKSTIISENLMISRNYAKVHNPMICPVCGGAIYQNGKDRFNVEKYSNYMTYIPDNITADNLHCSNYIKADGTNLTEVEIQAIRRDDIHVIYTSKSSKYPYLDEDGNELKGEELILAKKNASGYSILLKKCNHKIWGAKDQKGFRDYDSAKYFFKRFGKGSLSCTIYDEFHQLAKKSAQSYSFSYLCKASKVKIPLSGTLTGGKSSDLFYILWNLCPNKMVELGFKYNELGRFIDMFGRRKRVTKTYTETYNKGGTGRTVTGSWIEIPGISPQIINQILSERMVSRTIKDMGIPMPKLRYFKHVVEMDEDLSAGYNKLKGDIVSFIKKNKGINVGGSYLNSLLSYPDMPQQPPIYLCGDKYVATPIKIDIQNRIFNKEKKLIETIRKEISEDRRVLVYSVYSGIKGVSKRLVDILSKEFKVAELTSSIKNEKREEWIEKKYQEGVQVLITNPKCVETGLDIIQYQSIYYYETSYDIKVMRQSECRNYRPNMRDECRIYYSYYAETLQEDALKLQGNKKASSLAVEGVFSEDMLSQMGDLGESPSKLLNSILEGKIKLKESDLDAFAFEEEEVSYEFTDISNQEIEITRKITTSENITMNKIEANQLSIFEIDEEFLKKRNLKKAKAKVNLGQLGFIFE